ncbi:MAG: sigma-70 family RNA polymerase sigma factor [Proteobacteria bacterium]|nr:sigma-70 family RNA polymerase sigma factor [Pseudomonadota bacterium]
MSESEKRQLLDRNEPAFHDLYTKLNPAMVGLAQNYVSNRSTAEEVTQDAWLAVFNALHQFEGRSSLKTWIYRILINKAKTRGQREKRVVPFSSLSHRSEGLGMKGTWDRQSARSPEGNPHRIVVGREIRAQIESAMRRLPAMQQEVFRLRDLEGYSSKDAVRLLQISEVNQRVLLHRARKMIRQAIS